MAGGGKIVGLGLMIGSVVIFIAFAAWAGTALMTAETSSGGMVLGLVLALVVLTPIFGVGVYLFRSGTAEQGQYAVVQQERRILNMVLAQGQVTHWGDCRRIAVATRSSRRDDSRLGWQATL